MSLEEKIIAYRKLSREINALEEQKRDLSLEIMAEMPEKKVDVAGYRAYRHKKLSIKIPIEEARALNATKMEELVDKEKIKELYEQGQQMDGVKEITYLIVTAKKEVLELNPPSAISTSWDPEA